MPDRKSDVIVIGAGVNGLGAALLLARDGHRVRVLERDPAEPPADPAGSWTGWERRGVAQFRLLHSFLPRLRRSSRPSCPRSSPRWTPPAPCAPTPWPASPEPISGGFRPGDERFDVLTGRRPVIEAVMAGVAAAHARAGGAAGRPRSGACWRRRPRRPGVPHVIGVVTEDGERAAGRPGGRRRRPAFPAAAAGWPTSGARAARGEGGQRLHLLRPPLPLGRRLGPARLRRHPSSPTTRCRCSCCRPTTAPGAWASSPAPATPRCGRPARPRDVDAHRARATRSWPTGWTASRSRAST